MIDICPNCGNYQWDKEILENHQLRCPKCGMQWDFISLPLFFLTGCSGVGKTTTALEIMRKKVDFVVLDVDLFSQYVDWGREDSRIQLLETIAGLSRDIMQSGRPVLWTMAGCLDVLPHLYNCRYFSKLLCLALVCDDADLRHRMQTGRGITDENWLKDSSDYNRYFMEHNRIGDIFFETLNITNQTPDIVADYVIQWVRKNTHERA